MTYSLTPVSASFDIFETGFGSEYISNNTVNGKTYVVCNGGQALYSVEDNKIAIDTTSSFNDENYRAREISAFSANGKTYFCASGSGTYNKRKDVFYDENGKTLNIFLNYSECYHLSNGLILCHADGTNQKIYDIKTNTVHDDIYDSVTYYFSENGGWGRLVSDGKWYWINKNGQRSSTSVALNSEQFIYGTVGNDLFVFGDRAADWNYMHTAPNSGLIDKSGNIVFSPENKANAIGEFNDGIARVRKTAEITGAASSYKYAYINTTGKKITDFIYDGAADFSEGLAAVKQNDKWGYIDKTGNVVIPFTYYDAYPFQNGTAKVCMTREASINEEYIYINKSNQQVSAPANISYQEYILSEFPDAYEENYNGYIIITKTGDKIELAGTGIRPYLAGDKSQYIFAVKDGKLYRMTIEENKKDFNGISFSGKSYQYNGTKKEIIITGALPEGAKVEYNNNSGINEGTYNATAKITCEGYNDLMLNAILKINPAEITVRANDKQMVMGGAIPKLDYAIIGELYGNDKITGELKVNTDGKTVGEFDITQGTLAVSSNYKLTFEKGKLSVVDKTPQNITVSEITEKTYGDDSFKVEVTKDPVSNLDAFTYESSNPSVAEITADGTVTIKAAGETNITVKQAGNDTYAPFEKTQKLVVNKVSVTVTAEAKSKKIGAADPELTYTYTGSLVGDDKFTGKLERQVGEEVGQYDILIGTLAINDNYDITYNKAVFEIFDKTPQNIMVADFGEKTYGDAAFAVSVTADAAANLTNYTYESDNTDVAEVSADGSMTIKAAGEANITVKEPGNDEYAPFEKTVKLVVKKKAVTVTSVDIENKTAVLDGVLAEDAEDVTLDFDKITVEQGEAVDETTSNITLKNFVLKGDKAANYEITTESLPGTTANDNIVDITIAAENGVVTGAAKYIKGSSVTVTAAANSGYRFTGWYVDGEAVSTESTYTFTADNDVALTAKFERTRSSRGGGGGSSSAYTIKFDTNGGSELKNISVKSGQSIGTITEPKKDGYVFTGWYSDKELTKPYNKDEKVTASAILYAGWKIDPVRQLILTIGKKDAAVFGQTKSNDVAPKIVNDRTMLPARFVAENLGAVVTWNAEKQEVTVKGKNAKDEDITILIYIGSDIAYVNDEQIKLDSPAFIENDRTYTPVRFISERLGASVEWNETDKTVTITK